MLISSYYIDKGEAACVSNGGIVRKTEKTYCWKEGMYTQPQASAFCAKLAGRLPVIHTTQDNEDCGAAAGSVIL